MATKRIRQLNDGTPAGDKYIAFEGASGGTFKATIDDAVASATAPPAHASTHLQAGDDPINIASSDFAGLMDNSDKEKLDNIEDDAINAQAGAGLTRTVSTLAADFGVGANKVQQATAAALTATGAALLTDVASGVYTPTASAVDSNISNVTFPETWLWSRCGTVIRVLGRVQFDCAAATLTDTPLFDLTMPITVGSNFRAWGGALNFYVKHASLTGPMMKPALASGKMRCTCEFQQGGTAFVAAFDIAYTG